MNYCVCVCVGGFVLIFFFYLAEKKNIIQIQDTLVKGVGWGQDS